MESLDRPIPQRKYALDNLLIISHSNIYSFLITPVFIPLLLMINNEKKKKTIQNFK